MKPVKQRGEQIKKQRVATDADACLLLVPVKRVGDARSGREDKRAERSRTRRRHAAAEQTSEVEKKKEIETAAVLELGLDAKCDANRERRLRECVMIGDDKDLSNC